MALTPPPAVPQRGDRATFSDRVDAFLRWLANFVTELIGLQANLNSIAVGGAYAIPYQWGPGINIGTEASQSTTGLLAVSNTNSAGVSVLPLLRQFDASSSSIKGQIRIVAVGDTSRWIIFNIISRVENSGYQAFYGSVAQASSTNPFVSNDPVVLSYQRNGDKGDTGAGYYNLIGSFDITSSVAQVDFLNVVNSQYDHVRIDFANIAASASGSLCVSLAVGGGLTGTGHYNVIGGHNANITGQSQSDRFSFGTISSGSASVTLSGTFDIWNANSTNFKSTAIAGAANGSTLAAAGAFSGGAVSGMRIFASSGNLSGGSIRVYGIRKTA